MTDRPQWCGCKNRCAEEDAGCARPNQYGSCQLNAPGNDQSPHDLARKVFAAMTEAERATAKEYGAGDMVDRIREEAPAWERPDITDCLNEIDRLCGHEGDDE